MNVPVYFAACLAGLLPVIRSYGQDLQFYREDITFRLDEGRMLTNAVYYFCNVGPEDSRAVLHYPFPGNDIDRVDSLIVENADARTPVVYKRQGQGIYFEIVVRAYGNTAFRVFFRQQLQENHFRYILTSTAAWGRPLESASFQLLVPHAVTIDSLTYPPDHVFNDDNLRHYNWHKEDFMPDKDFEVFFHE